MFRWAVIGTGIIANKVLNEVTKTGRHQVAAAFSRTREKAEQFCKKFGGIVYDSAEEMLKSGGFDGVYIATPHSVHYAYAKMCLQYKVPSLVEKSFTLTRTQAAELCELSKQLGVYVSEAMWMRFSPVAKSVKSWVDAGLIGKIKQIDAQFSFNLHIGASTDRVTKPEYGGGAILDVGVYTVSLCQYLLGKPSQIECRVKMMETGVDERAIIKFGYPNGAVCNLKCGINGAIQNFARIVGEKGEIRLPLFFAMPSAKLCGNGIKAKAKSKIGYIYEFDRVAEDILATQIESKEISHADSIEVMEILETLLTNHTLIENKR